MLEKKKTKAWQFEAAVRQQPFFSSAAAASDFVVAGSRDKKVYGLDPKTGKAVWTFATEGQVDASPVIVNGRVYVGCLSDGGEFYVLDLKTGKKLQELALDAAVSGSAAVGPDFVFSPARSEFGRCGAADAEWAQVLSPAQA